MVGFVGSRRVGEDYLQQVAQVAKAFAEGEAEILVSDARGACEVVRQALPQAKVICAHIAPDIPVEAGLVRRAVALVQSVALAGGRLVAFVSRPCPAGLKPSRNPSQCFGFKSGTWSEVALAVGLGVEVVVVWCAPEPPSPPAWSGGCWEQVQIGGALCFRWRPFVQKSLF